MPSTNIIGRSSDPRQDETKDRRRMETRPHVGHIRLCMSTMQCNTMYAGNTQLHTASHKNRAGTTKSILIGVEIKKKQKFVHGFVKNFLIRATFRVVNKRLKREGFFVTDMTNGYVHCSLNTVR